MLGFNFFLKNKKPHTFLELEKSFKPIRRNFQISLSEKENFQISLVLRLGMTGHGSNGCWVERKVGKTIE